jgi:hypothetical protein
MTSRKTVLADLLGAHYPMPIEIDATIMRLIYARFSTPLIYHWQETALTYLEGRESDKISAARDARRYFVAD